MIAMARMPAVAAVPTVVGMPAVTAVAAVVVVARVPAVVTVARVPAMTLVAIGGPMDRLAALVLGVPRVFRMHTTALVAACVVRHNRSSSAFVHPDPNTL
ncbi:hypothetical protein [Murinocardiopsis flavida]|uniref:hypothetical protein n=1 Tax=Murinocardiopsis flavida TaxID=645275 RepID=UPI000D0D6B16|nr:hypothetical protein [Murinocardiopsis flavida]